MELLMGMVNSEQAINLLEGKSIGGKTVIASFDNKNEYRAIALKPNTNELIKKLERAKSIAKIFAISNETEMPIFNRKSKVKSENHER